MSGSFVAPWTVACQAPLSLGFSSQEYWNGLLFPSPGDLPDLKIEPASPALAGKLHTQVGRGKDFWPKEETGWKSQSWKEGS